MRRIRFATARLTASVLVAAMLLAGCASIGEFVSQPSAQTQAQLDQADALYRQGRIDQASAALDQVRRGRLQGEDAAHYDVLAAEIALRRGDISSALKLTAAPLTSLPPEWLARMLDVRARAHEAGGDAFGAARTRAQLSPLLEGAERARNEQKINDLLVSLGKQQLKQRYDALPDKDPLKSYAQAALQQLGVAMPRALPQLEHPVGTEIGEGNAVQKEGYRMPEHVALLLPVKGTLATPAAAVRAGFFTAYFGSGDTPRPQVRSYDTGGTPAQAQAAYNQAVTDGADLVIGPLGRDSVTALFAQASLSVPILALNRPDGTTPTPSGSAEFALLPEAEGAQAAAHMGERGVHQAVVFLTNDERARRAADAFKAQFESLGGQVLHQSVLPADNIDYSNAITTALTGVGSDAGILLLMRPQPARLLLPQLQLAGAKQPVFATSLIYAGSDNATADRDLDGVEFCDVPWLFDAQPGLPDHIAIAAKLPEARNAAARLFAFGMDAYALMPYLDWLRTHPGSYLPGATGQLAEDAQGEIHRVPVWVQFQDGIARPVAAGLDTAPTQAEPSTQ